MSIISLERRSGLWSEWPLAVLTILLSAALFATGLWYLDRVSFVPVLNDIVSIYRISSLEGPDRWLNGFYGPGFTILHDITGGSVRHTAWFFLVLMMISFWCTAGLAIRLHVNPLAALGSTFVFHLLLLALLKTNYSDGIFLFLLFSGITLFFTGVLSARGSRADLDAGLATMTGLLLAGSTVLFRHHGLPLMLMLIAAGAFIGSYRSLKLRSGIHRFVLYLLVLLFPLVVLITVGRLTGLPLMENWQMFNLYKFFYGVDWYRMEDLSASASWQAFHPIGTVVSRPDLLLRGMVRSLQSASFSLFFVFMTPLMGWLLFRQRIQGVLLASSALYTIIMLPGLDRGIYPLWIMVFLSWMLMNSRSSALSAGKVQATVLLLVLAGSVFHLVNEMNDQQQRNRYIREEMEPSLAALGVQQAGQILTDDFDLFLFRYDTIQLQTFNGWLWMHPHYRNYTPNEWLARPEIMTNQGIDHVIYRKNGYIERHYPELPCKEQIPLKHHVLCRVADEKASP